MSIEYTPEGLWKELRYAEEQNKRHLVAFDTLRRGYHTPWYDSHGGEHEGEWDSIAEDADRADPENHAYEFLSYIVPSLIGGKPKYALKSRRTDDEDSAHGDVKALEHALNQWVLDTDYMATMESVAVDTMFAFGAVLVTAKKNKAVYQQSRAQDAWPEVQRISPRNFFRDPGALRFEECRYQGHRWVMAADDLRALAESEPKAGWNMDVVEELEGVAMSEEYRPKHAQADSTERGEVELFEVWFPTRVYREDREEQEDTKPGEDQDVELFDEKDGFHGTIYTLAIVRGGPEAGQVHGEHKFVRKPRPYFGHRSGPYAHCGMMRVPDSPWPLAPLVATFGQAADLNALTRANSRDIRAYKNIVFVDADDGTLPQTIENNPHQTVVPFKGIGGTKNVRDMVQQVTVGGPSPEMAVAMTDAHERLRRNSGMGEAQTGQAPGSGTTATAVAVASQDATLRVSWSKERWIVMHEEVGLKVAFFLGTSKDVAVSVDGKAARELKGAPPGAEGATVKGGDFKPADFEYLQAEIDVLSVERVSEERVQARLMQATATVLQVVPLVMQFPVAQFWVDYFEMVGNAFNVPGLGKLAQKLVGGALAVLWGDLPSLATMAPPENPSVSAGEGKGKTEQQPMQPLQLPQIQMGGSAMNGSSKPGGNKTPGLSGVQQQTPLQGVGGSSRAR